MSHEVILVLAFIGGWFLIAVAVGAAYALVRWIKRKAS